MRPLFPLLSALALFACSPDIKETGEPSGDTGDTGETSQEPPSDYLAGSYRVTSMVILPDDEGFDLDGDGEVNNKLPGVLSLLDLAVEEDMSREGLNNQIASAIFEGDLVQLIDASYVELELTYDLLLGDEDEQGVLHLDEEQSLDDSGTPHSRYQGVFLDQESISLGPDDVQIPVTFYPDEPAIMIPVADSIAEGSLADTGTSGMFGGAIPVDQLMDQVVEPLIPEEGYGDQTKEELLESVEQLLSSDSVADIELADGSRAISAALSFESEPAVW